MFFGNNTEYDCARDIVDIRKIKADLVSVNVDKLINDGYLKREQSFYDRRKHCLLLMEKAKYSVKKR